MQEHVHAIAMCKQTGSCLLARDPSYLRMKLGAMLSLLYQRGGMHAADHGLHHL